jgi:hypothetical protein
MTEDETRSWFHERHTWPAGPWDNEPDHVEWMSESGLPCLAQRNPYGAWCGYVGIPPEHPWWGLDSQEYPAYDVDVHGGLTYDAGGDDGEFIHEVTTLGDVSRHWWFGFDCGHAMDLTPGLVVALNMVTGGSHYQWDIGSTYRDLSYVTSEVDSLAEQLKFVFDHPKAGLGERPQ